MHIICIYVLVQPFSSCLGVSGHAAFLLFRVQFVHIQCIWDFCIYVLTFQIREHIWLHADLLRFTANTGEEEIPLCHWRLDINSKVSHQKLIHRTPPVLSGLQKSACLVGLHYQQYPTCQNEKVLSNVLTFTTLFNALFVFKIDVSIENSITFKTFTPHETLILRRLHIIWLVALCKPWLSAQTSPVGETLENNSIMLHFQMSNSKIYNTSIPRL